jgi:hypothetical protein
MASGAEIVAKPAQEETLYRVVRTSQPRVEDFRCHREQPRRRPLPAFSPWLLVVGVSMFETREGALQIARRRPAWIAEVRLPAGQGIHVAATGSLGHRTVWAESDALAACVQACDMAA